MSKIIQIKTPATSANLGPGFDFFGIALSLYNVIQFEEVDDGKQIIEEIGFQNVGENLCKKCFEYIINKYCKAKKHYIISLIQNDIPVARGLGSSASAIVSGMVGANYFINNMLDESQLIDEMVNVEGHPDNILPCYLGGAVSSIYTDKLNYFKYNVNKDLYFNVLIPKYKVSTADARGVLPNNYQLSDVVFNSSRVMLLPKALESGDIDLVFHPIIDRYSNTNALIIQSNQHQVFGYFDGTIKVDDKTIELKHLLGFAEMVKNRW